MPADFAPLRDAPLPDSFDRTAAWLRSAPPPRPPPGKPLALAAALALAVGACAWPVEADAVVGYVVEATTGAPRDLVRALDRAVAADARVSAEIEPRGAAAAVRYVVLDAGAADQAAQAATAAGVEARVSPLGAGVRQPFGLAAARWVGVTASPRLDDAELQAALDRAFAEHPALAPRVGRDGRGRRVVGVARGLRLVLPPGARISRSGSVLSVVGDFGHVGDDGTGRARLSDLLDDLAPGVTVDTTNARARSMEEVRARLDSLGVAPEALDDLLYGGADSARSYLIHVPDPPPTR